jgi:hypothetical protein
VTRLLQCLPMQYSAGAEARQGRLSRPISRGWHCLTCKARAREAPPDAVWPTHGPHALRVALNDPVDVLGDGMRWLPPHERRAAEGHVRVTLWVWQL